MIGETVTAILSDINVQVTANGVEACHGLGSHIKINPRKQ